MRFTFEHEIEELAIFALQNINQAWKRFGLLHQHNIAREILIN